MAIITPELVRLNQQAASKEEAIALAGAVLVEAGRVRPGYVAGMLAREKTMSTYVGNGVAIPHGEFDSRQDILQTSVSAVQFPAGVDWGEGERAYLVFGIAAVADEHIGVLANLAQVVELPEAAEELARTTEPGLIVERLGRPAAEE